MSKELKRRGFGFVGSTICYAFMQAVGMVDDHVVTCLKRRPPGVGTGDKKDIRDARNAR
jgi:3-methyladenine DNA glycosylase Tag